MEKKLYEAIQQKLDTGYDPEIAEAIMNRVMDILNLDELSRGLKDRFKEKAKAQQALLQKQANQQAAAVNTQTGSLQTRTYAASQAQANIQKLKQKHQKRQKGIDQASRPENTEKERKKQALAKKREALAKERQKLDTGYDPEQEELKMSKAPQHDLYERIGKITIDGRTRAYKAAVTRIQNAATIRQQRRDAANFSAGNSDGHVPSSSSSSDGDDISVEEQQSTNDNTQQIQKPSDNTADRVSAANFKAAALKLKKARNQAIKKSANSKKKTLQKQKKDKGERDRERAKKQAEIKNA
jgi:hypothetical protein